MVDRDQKKLVRFFLSHIQRDKKIYKLNISANKFSNHFTNPHSLVNYTVWYSLI